MVAHEKYLYCNLGSIYAIIYGQGSSGNAYGLHFTFRQSGMLYNDKRVPAKGNMLGIC